MAAHTFHVITAASPLTPPVATDVAGDTFAYSGSKTPILVFTNGHTGSITIDIAGQNKTVTIGSLGSGTFKRSDITLALAAGATASIPITTDTVKSYVDDGGLIDITYTGGNVALTVFGIEV